jgi:prevent-host-death family protein
MKLVTISDAKANLRTLIEAAENGQQVLIMRGSRPAVTLTPVTEMDLELAPRISESSLADFDDEIEADRMAGRLGKLGSSVQEAADHLRKL